MFWNRSLSPSQGASAAPAEVPAGRNLQWPASLPNTAENAGISNKNFSLSTGQSIVPQGENLKKYSVPSPFLNVTYDVYEMPLLENGSSSKQILQNIYSASKLNQSSSGINVYNNNINAHTGPSGPSLQNNQSLPQPQEQQTGISQRELSVHSLQNQSASGLKSDNLPGQTLTTGKSISITTGITSTTFPSTTPKLTTLNQITTQKVASTINSGMASNDTGNLVSPQGRAMPNSSSLMNSMSNVSYPVAVKKTNTSGESQTTPSSGYTSTATTVSYSNQNSSASVSNTSSSLNLTHSTMNNASSQPAVSSDKSISANKTGNDYSNSEKMENARSTTEENKDDGKDKSTTSSTGNSSTEATTINSQELAKNTILEANSSETSQVSRSIGMDYSVVETENEIKVTDDKNINETKNSTNSTQAVDATKEANNTKFPSTSTESLIMKNSSVPSSIDSTTISSTTDTIVTTSGPTLGSSSEKSQKGLTEEPKETKVKNVTEIVPTNNTTLAPPKGNKTEEKSSDAQEGLNMHITINDKSKGASYKTVNMSTDSLLEEEKHKKDGGEDYQDGGNIFPLEHSPRSKAGTPRSIPKHQILNINNFKSVGAPVQKVPGKEKKWMVFS
jgi:hypothetical protein